MTRTVVVFGATGYVGGYLVAELAGRGHDVVVVRRGAAELAVPGARVLTDAELASLRGRSCAIVNLAYPRAAPGLEVRAANERLIERVTRAVEVTGATRLIHTSTQAVFGYEWRRAPRVGPAPLVLGDSYIESKRYAENALRAHWRRGGRAHDLVIVRLGNVLGAGAMPWVSATAERILEGRAAAGGGGRGRLNGTDVRNIADYLATLVEQEGRLADGVPGVFHHLAEHAERTWSELIEPMSSTIGVGATYRADVPVLGSGGVKSYAKTAGRRFAGVLERHRGLLTLAQRLKPLPRPHANAPSSDDPGWYAITGGAIALPPALLPSWRPPHAWESMLREIDEWLPAHGFVLRAERR